MIKDYIKGTATALLLGISATSVSAQSEYWHQKVSLYEILPVKQTDIVFLGNSITDGGEFAELFDNSAIKNRGIQSDVISGVRKRLSQITAGHPSKIFLLIGINDISHNLSVTELVSRYESLVKDIRQQSPETELYIQSVMPINNSFGRYKNLRNKEKTVSSLNMELKKIAERNNATYIDLHPALSNRNGNLRKEFTNDGLHLTGAGYKAWADHIRPYVDE